MVSVNTNAAAITALRTLQNTNRSLDATQNRISTGYKIGEAKDNAAYWSIATTLKSDNKALGTVKDALGLGSATVDVAYQSLNKAKDVLDEMKSKLVAATQDGVDKSKIQSEISELQKQLKAIASSANFSGENWLDVDSLSSGYSATKKVVSSYSTDTNGAVTIGTVDIDTSSMVLINRGTDKEGILDGGVTGNTYTGGLASTGNTEAASTKGNVITDALTFTLASGTLAADDKFQLSYKIDGVAYTTAVITMAAAGTSVDNFGDEIVAKLNADATFTSKAVATWDTANDKLKIESRTTGSNSSAQITGLSFKDTSASDAALALDAANTASITTGTTPTTDATQTNGVNAKSTAAAAFAAGNDIEAMDDNDSLSFDVTLDSNKTRVTVNKALISSVLGTTDGKISSVGDFKTVLREALRVSGLSNVDVSDASGNIVFSAGNTLTVTNVSASKGEDLTSFNMATADAPRLASLISAVNAAAEKVISAAATLGSVASRIDMQKSFVDTLMDTIDKGVGGLIDADMSEESTKLQALQVKQQLGVQSLSIANQSAQNILSLFRS